VLVATPCVNHGGRIAVVRSVVVGGKVLREERGRDFFKLMSMRHFIPVPL
jgi:hypothetical protein